MNAQPPSASDALRQAQSAVQRQPEDPQAWTMLGYLLLQAGRFKDAEAAHESLIRLEPNEPSHWMNLGTARRGAGDADAALSAYSRAAALGEASANFLFNVGLTHIDRKDFESGRAVLSKAAALEPDDAEIRYFLALCCYERVRTEEAVQALQGWESLAGLNGTLIADIGLLLMKLGEPRRAEPAIRRALALDADNPQTRLTLAQMLERTNRVAEATGALQALESDPRARSLGQEFVTLQATLAQRNGRHERAVQLYQGLLAQNPEPQLAHLLQFPLAKSLDALGRYAQSFDTLTAAHASQALLLRLTAPMASARGAPTMTITRYGVDPQDVAAWRDAHAPGIDASPVFIVAFPRSGTTLLELTLDAHPALKSMDEQPFVQNALDDMLAWGIGYPEKLAALTPDQLRQLRERYWERVRTRISLQAGQRLVDKNPLNILRLPVIRRLFPHAPIILAIRHPCDVMLSCYMQHFRTPDFALLCQDLATLANGYRHSFDFWYRQVALLEPPTMELRYETFVEDFRNQVEDILRFLRLPWSDSLLRHRENAQQRGFISTPSYAQVVEPVNNKGVGRWRHYEAQFAQVLPVVQPYLDRWGYEGLGSSNSR